MCLTITNRTPQIAKKDIVCYKVLRHNFLKRSGYTTPYMYTSVTLGELMEDKVPVKIHNSIFLVKYNLYEGVFHTFKYYSDAVEMCKEDIIGNSVVVRCIIPKGTEYYVGTWGEVISCYGSKQLQYTKKVLKRFEE